MMRMTSILGERRTTPLRPRYESLDLWRGVACLMVLLNHATFTVPGSAIYESLGATAQMWSQIAARLWCGVPIFFVISGYCIAATADSQRRRGRPAMEYFIRRFRRIFPPYWVVLIGTVVTFTAVDVLLWPRSMTGTGEFLRPWWYSASQWFGNVTLTELWRSHAFGTSKAMILGHAWTLCYEEQFYIVVGVLLLAAPHRFFGGLVLVTGGVLAARLLNYGGHSAEGFFWDGAWLLFFPGVVAYYVLNYRERLRYPSVVILFALAAWCARTPSVLLAMSKNEAQELFVAALFAATILLLRDRDQQLVGSARLRPLLQCGLMCYSLYLVHLPIAILMRGSLSAAQAPGWLWNPALTVPVCSAICIFVASVFHQRVERRFMNLPQVRAPKSNPQYVGPIATEAVRT